MNLAFLLRYCSLLCVGLLAGNAVAFGVGMMAEDLENLTPVSYQIMMVFIGSKASYLYFGAFASLGLTLFSLRRYWKTLHFISLFFAFICLGHEVLLSTSSQTLLLQHTKDWMTLRSQWAHFLYWRCSLLTSSFILLVISSFTTGKSQASSDVVAAV